MDIIRSCFTDNVANTGGVIWTDRNTLTVNQTTFTNNTANFGGVLWAQQATVNSHDVTLSSNSANTNGGVFHTKKPRHQLLELTSPIVGLITMEELCTLMEVQLASMAANLIKIQLVMTEE